MKKTLLGMLSVTAIGLYALWNFDGSIEEPNLYIDQLNKFEKYSDLSFEEISKLDKQDRPDLALLQEFEMTKDPALGYPPVFRKIEAFKEAKSILKKNSSMRAIEGVEWQERGPNNVGGRTRAIMFDPNDPTAKKVWSGSVSGGIWYNMDITQNGSKWTNSNDFMANLSISSFAYDPNETTVFYAGTGEVFTGDFRGTGIWQSTDAGATWNQIASTVDFSYVQKVIVTANSTVVAATINGIKVSSDQGATWSSPDKVTAEISDLELAADGALYAGSDFGDVYKSTDDGATWDLILDNSGRRVEIAVAPSNAAVVFAVAAQGGAVAWMSSSSDGGDTWNDVDFPNYYEQSCDESASDDYTRGQAWYDLIIGISPEDDQTIFIGGIDLYKSTDGGTSWDLISYWTGACAEYVHADQHNIVFRPGYPNTALFANDGGVAISQDLDVAKPAFYNQNAGYNVTQFYATALRNETNSYAMLAGAQDNGTHQFSNFGVGGTRQVTGGDGAYCFIDQDNPDIQITSYVYNNYYLSRDGGATFPRDDQFGYGNEGSFINAGDYDDLANTLYSTGGENEINRYKIGASTVESSKLALTIGNASHIKASPFEDHVLFVGNFDGQLFKVSKANGSPEMEILLEKEGRISSVELADGGNKMLVTYSSYGVVSVWYSSDAGDSFTNIEGDLPDMPVWWGLFNPLNPSEVLLATEVGVWSSDNILATEVTWEPTNEGLANVSCRMLQHRAADDMVAVTTHGRGVFTSYSFSNTVLASIEAETEVVYQGQSITFNNASLGKITTTKWTLPDGSSSADSEVSYMFTKSGVYTVELVVNGVSYAKKSITVLPTRSVNYLADFENEPADVYLDNVAGTAFSLGNSEIDGKSGVTSGDNAIVLGINDDKYGDNSVAVIYFPNYNFSMSGSYILSFQSVYSFEDEWDGFIVDYSTDLGGTWTKLGDKVESGWYNTTSNADAIFGNQVPIFSGATNGYELIEKDVTFLAGENNVTFRLVFLSDVAEVDIGMAIDDFKIEGPSTAPVADFAPQYQEQFCKEGVITFNNHSSTDATTLTWNFGSGATPATADGIGPHDVTYSTEGIKAVSLTVANASGVESTKTSEVVVKNTLVQESTISLEADILCNGESAVILIANSVADRSYQVMNVSTGQILDAIKSGSGGDIQFVVDGLSEATTFNVQISKNGYCNLASDELVVSVSDLVETSLNESNFEICEGEFATVTINDSFDGMNYQLWDVANDVAISEVVVGTGAAIDVPTGMLSADVLVDVTAGDPTTSCNITFKTQVAVTVYANPDATITASDFVLSLPEGADEYTWKKNGFKIFGETNSTYTVTANGNYSATATKNNCTSESEEVKVIVTAVDDVLSSVGVYPNPTKGLVTFQGRGIAEVNVMSISGRVIENKSLELNGGSMDVSSLDRGTYLMVITLDGKKKVQKLILE